MKIDIVRLIVRDYDDAIEFFLSKLGFEMVEEVAGRINTERSGAEYSYGRRKMYM